MCEVERHVILTIPHREMVRGTRRQRHQQRRRTRRRQTGGSRETLEGMFDSPEAMAAGMDFYAISGHGETTRDNVLFMVPENTYLLFASQSGTTAPGENNEVAVIETGTDAARYRALFTRDGHGLQGGEFYFYEPGDLIPDYAIHFENNDTFVARLGVFKLPMVEADFVGMYPHVMQQYFKNGKLDAVVAQLDAIPGWPVLRDATPALLKEKRRDFSKWTSALVGRARRDPASPEAAIVAAIETEARGGADNLVRDAISPANKWTLRVSDILRMPAVAGRPGVARFFMMNFCRVSYSDMIGDYAAEVPVAIRALSESQKCSLRREHALNMGRIAAELCAMPTEAKLRFLRERGGFDLVFVLKKVMRMDWAACLGDTYGALTAGERSRLRSAYRGAMTAADLAVLARVELPEMERLRGAVARYREELQKVAERKRRMIMFAYKTINKWLGIRGAHGLEGVTTNEDGMPIPQRDYLDLQLMRIWKLSKLLEYLGVRVTKGRETKEEKEERLEHARELRAKLRSLNVGGSPSDLRTAIQVEILEYTGAQPKDPFVGDFAWVNEANTSVPEPAPPPPARPVAVAASAAPAPPPRTGPRNPWSNSSSSPPPAAAAPPRKRNPWSDDNL